MSGLMAEAGDGAPPSFSSSSARTLIFLICCAGMFFNAYEISASMVFGAVFHPSATISAGSVGLLLSAGTLGAAVGAPLMGQAADRFGRRATMIVALVGSGLLSLGCAAVSDIHALIAVRLLASLFLGAYFPIVATYLVEILPGAVVSRNMLLISVASGVGVAAVILIAAVFADHPVAGLAGWQSSVGLGGVGTLLIAAATWWKAVESPAWLRTRARAAEADRIGRLLGETARPATDVPDQPTQRAPAQSLLAPALRGRLLLIVALQFLATWSMMFMMLQGALFAGDTQTESAALYAAGFATLPICLGSLITASVARRLHDRWLIIVIALLMASFAVAFSASTDNGLRVLLAGGFNMMVASYFNLLMTFSAQIFPASTRGRATSVVTMSFSITSAAAPLIGLPMIAAGHSIALLWAVALAQIGVMALMLLIAPRMSAPIAG